MTIAAQLVHKARETLTEAAEFDVETGDFHFTVDEILRVRAAMNLACEALDAEEKARAPRLTPTRTHQLARLAGAGV